MCHAVNVIPFSGELDLSKQSNYKIRVSNNSNSEAAVKISVKAWSFDADGKEARTPSSDLLIFPKQMLLRPNSERNIRVSYRQKKPPINERAYRIIIEEVPLQKSQQSGFKKKAAINILTRYVTALYVKPINAKSQIEIVESIGTENGFFLRIRNVGNSHTHFIQPTITISQKETKLLLTDLQLLEDFAKTNIFSLGERSYNWDIPEALRSTLNLQQPYNVTLDWICENCDAPKDKITFIID